MLSVPPGDRRSIPAAPRPPGGPPFMARRRRRGSARPGQREGLHAGGYDRPRPSPRRRYFQVLISSQESSVRPLPTAPAGLTGVCSPEPFRASDPRRPVAATSAGHAVGYQRLTGSGPPKGPPPPGMARPARPHRHRFRGGLRCSGLRRPPPDTGKRHAESAIIRQCE